MKLLADSRADVTAKDSSGATAEDLADKVKEEEIAKFLKVNKVLVKEGNFWKTSATK